MIKLFEHTLFAVLMLLAVAAVCTSCRQDDPEAGTTAGLPAVIRLKVTGQEGMDTATRTVSEDAVHDLHILIYDAKGELIGQQYAESSIVTVHTHSATGCTIYAVANTGKPDLFNSYNIHSEAALKKLTASISAWDELTNGTHLPMTGCTEEKVDIVAGTQTLSGGIKVSRMAAKIILDIGVKTGSSVTITDYNICSLPTKSYYIPRPTTTESDIYDSGNTQPGDDAPGDHWIDSPATAVDGNKASASFFMFENRRGVNPSILVQNDKGHTNAPSNATYVNINGTVNGININWKIYLGANNTDNFNIKRNCTYTYKILLDATTTADSRVTIEAMGVIDLSSDGRANCYLAYKDQQWFSFDGTVRGNGETEDYAVQQYGSVNPDISLMPDKVGTSTDATRIPAESIKDAVVVWETERGLIDLLIWDCNTGQVKFKTGTAKGNALIAVRDASENILWSWHIWRTDGVSLRMLNEDASKHVIQITTNTDRQWYADKMGRSDVKRRRTMTMLRCNLGAQLDDAASYNTPEGNIGAYSLHYQFGRKDPFPGSTSYTACNDITLYGYGSSDTYQTAGFTIKDKRTPVDGPFASSAKSILNYSIKHPEVFIYGPNTWFVNNIQVGSEAWMINRCLWGDNNTSSIMVNDGGMDPDPWGTPGEKGKKTIYDPSPAGWRVAPADSWSGISNDNMPATWIQIGQFVFQDGFNKGYVFYFNSEKSGVSTYIPATGWRGGAGELTSVGSDGFLWLSSPSGTNTVDGTYFYSTPYYKSIHIASDRQEAFGFAIRCVKIEP